MNQITKNIKIEDLWVTNKEQYRTRNKQYVMSQTQYAINAVILSFKVLQPLFDSGFITKINSFIRCPELNSSVGGSKTSQHMTGEAADCHVSDVAINRIKTLGFLEVWRMESENLNCLYHDLNQVIYYPKDKFIHVALGYPYRPAQIGVCEGGKITWLGGK